MVPQLLLRENVAKMIFPYCNPRNITERTAENDLTQSLL